MKTYQQFTLEAYDRSTGRPHRGTDYKGRDYGGGPDDKPTVKIPLSGVMQGGWSKKEKKKKDVNEAGDWWHPDPEEDKKLPGKGPQMRAREDRGQSTSAQTKPDYSNRLKPGETYLQYSKRKQAERAERTRKEEVDLSETSLTRVMRKSKKGGMAIMSAQRGDKSKAENKARSRQLERDVRGAGLPGPTKVSGRYTENPGTPQEKKVGEKSHIITPGKKGKRKFKKAIEKLGQKYNQDSVLIQRKAGGSSTLKGTSKTSWPGKGKNVKIGSMKPGRTGEFDTKVKNKTFTVED